MAHELVIEWLGRVPYREALELQRRCVEARRRGSCGDLLLLLEHPAVITAGRRADPANLLVDRHALSARGIEVHQVTRGGDFTYHGPGQLIGYAILDLRARKQPDVIAFLRRIEAALIEALCTLGIHAATRGGSTGVFTTGSRAGGATRSRKIASIGVGMRGWVTYHGFALNVGDDLSGFDLIVPCGLHDVEMTSVACELGSGAPGEVEVRELVSRAFLRQFSAWSPQRAA
jgi:lipoate-protein ligase B